MKPKMGIAISSGASNANGATTKATTLAEIYVEAAMQPIISAASCESKDAHISMLHLLSLVYESVYSQDWFVRKSFTRLRWTYGTNTRSLIVKLPDFGGTPASLQLIQSKNSTSGVLQSMKLFTLYLATVFLILVRE